MNPAIESMKQELDRVKWIHRYTGGLQCVQFITLLILLGLQEPNYFLNLYNFFSVDVYTVHTRFIWTPEKEYQSQVHCLVIPVIYTLVMILYHLFSLQDQTEFLTESILVTMTALAHSHIATFVGVTDITTLFFLFLFSLVPSLKFKDIRINNALVWLWILIYYFRAVHATKDVPEFIGAMVFLTMFFEVLLHLTEKLLQNPVYQQYFRILVSFVYTTFITWITYGGADSLHVA